MPYHTYTTLVSDLQHIVATDPNGISALYDLGTTHDNNHIYAISIGQYTPNKSLFVGCHHANEWMSVEIPYLLAEYLVNNYANPVIQSLIECRQIWIIPMLNPDGHEYSQRVRMWRKNRRFNGHIHYNVATNQTLLEIFDAVKDREGPRDWEEIYDDNGGLLLGLTPPVSRSAASIIPAGNIILIPCYGVDLNRNYDYSWGLLTDSYNSDQMQDNSYWGPNASSEPEVQILKSLLNLTNPAVSSVIGTDPFRALITYHTAAQEIHYPWNWNAGIVEVNDPYTIALGHGMSDLTNLAGTRYQAKVGASIYPTYGDLQDWVWDQFQIPNYTFEMDTAQIRPASNILPVFRINIHPALALINCSHPATQISCNITAPSSGNVYVRSTCTTPCDIAVGSYCWDIWGAGYPVP